jgi:hypothetical protein
VGQLYLPPPDVIGIPTSVALVLARRRHFALTLGTLVAYPSGFEFTAVVRGAVGSPSVMSLLSEDAIPLGEAEAGTGVAFTLQLSDGTMLATANSDRFGETEVYELLVLDGSGNDRRVSTTFWCPRLPPPGPLGIECRWNEQDLQAAVSIDADEIRQAAARSIAVWD